MPTSSTQPQGEALAALRRFTRTRPPAERCELCGAALGEEHSHLLERERRRIACACEACSILFCGQENPRFLRVPRRVKRLGGFSYSDEQWEAMMLPIGLAFFLRGKDGGTVAMYPSPAGAMESLIPLAPWEELFGREAALRKIAPEVEALVANRIGNEAAYFIVPIDLCYRLVGLIRMHWRGLSGGVEVWKAVAEFFGELDRRAGKASETRHA
jgi:Family of unknown function (DUF5947)